MLACLVHDFGKGLTPRDQLPKHYGHDVKGVSVVKNFCDRLTVPVNMRDAAISATRYHMSMHRLCELKPKTFVRMFDDMGAKNDPRKVIVLYWVGICDHRGRLGSENEDPSHLSYLLNVWNAVQRVRFDDVFPNGETNVNKIKDGMFKARIKAIAEIL
jgi:tRNA nucleotidyltransferase (CCA-adding enzyme)